MTQATTDLARPRPEAYQPRLGWWGHGWRLLLMLLVSSLVWFSVDQERRLLPIAADLVLGVTALALTTQRRRHPLPVAVATALLAAVSASAAGPATLATVSLATRRVWRPIVAVAVLNVVTSEVFAWLNPSVQQDPWWITTASDTIFVAGTTAWGLYIGSRRELLWTLRARAERAEAEQALRATQSRLAERGRIAREMHDVLAHRISQISMRAGAMAYREDLDAAALRAEAAVVREAAHRALTDLREVLGVLRDADGGVLDRPQPTYADLPELVEEAREAGLIVEYVDGLPAGTAVPDPVGRTVYRIIQEGMTNARKHAPGARLCVVLGGGQEEGVEVELRNPLGFATAGRARTTPPGAGLGLIGLAERAQLAGGRLAGAREGDDFVLRGWIPWPT